MPRDARETTLRLCPRSRRLRRPGGAFDAWALRWEICADPLPDAADLSPADACAALHAAGPVRAVPVGVIGPKVATESQVETAGRLGARIAQLGLQLLCGGKNGVMEAVCRGNLQAGGRPIGLVPDEEWDASNPFVAVPLATGIGPARNVLIARASFALVAVGGGYGTLSEMAFGLHFGRLVLALDDAPAVDGATRCAGVDEVCDRLARRFLGVAAV
ncbi:DNA-binding protein [Salinarimonas chemoclinalis]|uniref:SLOG cluster 4 domain-containing protein n=1 Tax=Salinarimonas chemoclinalis TaxID=3241599 RepID=UPI003558C227